MGIRKTGKSQELITTLSQLENAIRDWERTPASTQPEGNEKNQESPAPQLAQSLLKKLRQQIDDLSE